MIHLPNLKHISDEDIADILERAHKIKRNPRDYTVIASADPRHVISENQHSNTRVFRGRND